MGVPALSLVKKLAAVATPVSTFTLTLTLDGTGTCSGLKFDTDCTINWGGSNGSTILTKNTEVTHPCGTIVTITGPNTTTSVQLRLSTGPTITGISGTFPTSCITLDLSGCTKLTTIPTLPATLTELNLTGCTGITKIKADPAKIKTLDCTGSGILTPIILAVPNAWKFPPPIVPIKLSDIAVQNPTNTWKLNKNVSISTTRPLTIPAGVTLDMNGCHITNTGIFINLGTIDNLTAASIIDNNYGGTFTNTGTIKINDYSTINTYNGGIISNTGTISNGGTIANNDGGVFNNTGIITNKQNCFIINQPKCILNNNLGGTINNSGYINNNSTSNSFSSFSRINNFGLITNDAGGTITNMLSCIISNKSGGRISNNYQGSIYNSGSIYNAADATLINNRGGTISNRNGNNDGILGGPGVWTNAGTVTGIQYNG